MLLGKLLLWASVSFSLSLGAVIISNDFNLMLLCCGSHKRIRKLSIKYIVIAQTMLAVTVVKMIVAFCSALGITPFAFIFTILNGAKT